VVTTEARRLRAVISVTFWWIRKGFVLKTKVHSAKVMDWDGIKTLLCSEQISSSLASNICGWMPATGEKTRGKDWVERTLGWSVDLVERPRKGMPQTKEVLMRWAEQWLHEGVVVDWEKLCCHRRGL
jgi:hypothetical protein